MNVAKGADYMIFFRLQNNLYAFQIKKADTAIGFSFISKLTATENDGLLCLSHKVSFLQLLIAR